MMNSKGYSLVELIVVMGIFVIVIMISSSAFESLIKKGGQQSRSAETQITGIVGLEMMRADIVHAGYGLPWTLQVTPASAFSEVTASPASGLGVDATTFNDATPRAIRSKTSTTTGIDYLVVKSTAVGMSQAAHKWSYLIYSFGALGNVSYIKTKGDPATDLQVNDRVVTLNSGFTSSGAQVKELRMVNETSFSQTVPAGYVPTSDTYKPIDPTQTFLVYGISTTAESAALSMPYNRVDFFVDKSAPKPASCNPGTGVLFKAVANHAGGYTKLPLLDCVGDMQVVYERDDGGIIFTDESVVDLLSAEQIRTQIKNVRIYVLAQEGKKDSGFVYPVVDANSAIVVAPTEMASRGRVWSQSALATTFGADWNNYRWKVYPIVVNLKNLGDATP